MTQEEKNLIQLSKFTIIKDKRTSKPHLDHDFSCLLYELYTDADAYVNRKENKDLYIENSDIYTPEKISAIYAEGVQELTLILKDKSQKKIKIGPDDLISGFYNNKANGIILLLKQTLEKQYLRMMKDIRIFAPVYIKSRFPKRYPEIHYSYAKFNEKDAFYVLFTTLQEYEEWVKTQDEKIQLMETTFVGYKNIYKNNSIIINPLSDKLILNKSHLKILNEGNS